MLISLCLSEFRVYKYHLRATLLDTQDFTNPYLLKTQRTLNGLSFVVVVLPSQVFLKDITL